MPRCQDGVLRNLAGPLLLSSLTGRLRGAVSAVPSAVWEVLTVLPLPCSEPLLHSHSIRCSRAHRATERSRGLGAQTQKA